MRVLPVRIYSNTPKRYDNLYKNRKNERQTPATDIFSYKNQFLGENSVSFKGMPCSTGNFPMKKVYKLECPSCGQVMLTNKQVNSFANKASGRKGCKLSDTLLEKAPYYRGVERVISEEMVELLNDYPEADLKTATTLLAADAKTNLENSQRKILSQMREESKKLSDDKRKDMETALDTAEEKILKSGQDSFFKRKEFIGSIEEIRDKYKNAEDENEIELLNGIVKMAQEMPNSESNKNAFYVKYSRNRSNEEIARRLVLPSIVTTEHVQAHSKGGENNTANYIPMCGECNSKRGNMPYHDWFKIHPEMPYNLQKYIDSVSQMIFDGTLDDDEYLDTYVDEIICAISNATNGELKLKKPDPKTLEMYTAELERKEKQEILIAKIDKIERALDKTKRAKTKLEGDEEYVQMVDWAKQMPKDEQNPETNVHPPYETVEDIEEKIKEKTKLLNKIQKLKKSYDSLIASTHSSQDSDERLAELRDILSELNESGCDVNKIRAEIKALKKRRTEISFKLKNVHIDDNIAQLEQKLKELKREYDSI
ncbi:MAG: HNH endonuclease [Candidatus Gastranaerophilales bacterium]|nr:HNH endonuclease [Candidatus Gastranaerophilales bacterium]